MGGWPSEGRKVKGRQRGIRCPLREVGVGRGSDTGKKQESEAAERPRAQSGVGKAVHAQRPRVRAVDDLGAHLVTVRLARGLCALSRPRRTPMPTSTSSAATPHTA